MDIGTLWTVLTGTVMGIFGAGAVTARTQAKISQHERDIDEIRSEQKEDRERMEQATRDLNTKLDSVNNNILRVYEHMLKH